MRAIKDGGTGTDQRAALRRWWWAVGIVLLGVLAFLAVRGSFRLLTAVGVVVALVALIRPPARSR